MKSSVNDYVIREATAEDHGMIYDFSLIASKDETVPDFLRNAGEFVIKKIEEGRSGVLLAFSDEELAGIVDADILESKIEIRSVYVRKDHRRKGLASHLVNKLMEIYPNKEMVLATAVTEKGKKFWESNGFRVMEWKMVKKMD